MNCQKKKERKKMKTPRRQKFLAFFLAIALSLTLIPAQVLAIEIDQ